LCNMYTYKEALKDALIYASNKKDEFKGHMDTLLERNYNFKQNESFWEDHMDFRYYWGIHAAMDSMVTKIEGLLEQAKEDDQ